MEALARRVIDALPTVSGTVLVRDRCGRADVVEAVVDECRRRGLDPVVEHVSNDRLREIIGSAPPAELARWDLDRADLTPSVNGLIVLGGWSCRSRRPADGGRSTRGSRPSGRVERALEQRKVPTVVVAVPTEYVADAARHHVGGARTRVCCRGLLMSAAVVERQRRPLLAALEATSEVEVVTGAGTLAVERGRRPLMVDDGVVDRVDLARGAVVSNLPGGIAVLDRHRGCHPRRRRAVRRHGAPLRRRRTSRRRPLRRRAGLASRHRRQSPRDRDRSGGRSSTSTGPVRCSWRSARTATWVETTSRRSTSTSCRHHRPSGSAEVALVDRWCPRRGRGRVANHPGSGVGCPTGDRRSRVRVRRTPAHRPDGTGTINARGLAGRQARPCHDSRGFLLGPFDPSVHRRNGPGSEVWSMPA